MSDFSRRYVAESHAILDALDLDAIDKIVKHLENLAGRLFILGVGGSAATASHAVNDFRKISHIEAYCPTDNVAELTARTNDDGWEWVFRDWLRVSRLDFDDAVLVLSVGGGSLDVSRNIMIAVAYAKSVGARVLGVVGRDGGETAGVADAVVVIPPMYPERVTPHTEGIASVILHMIVSQLRRTT